MRIVLFIVILAASWMLSPAVGGGDGVLGIKNLWAVKPPTVSERQGRVDNPDQQKGFVDKVFTTKRPARTKGGKYCECGRSEVDPYKCYYPKQGQYCCNPKTNDCHVVKTTKWNVPFKD